MMPRAIRRAAYLLGYLYVGFWLPVCMGVAAFLLVSPLSAERRLRGIRWVIRRLCVGFIGWLRFGGALELDLQGIDGLRRRRGIVVAANHPTFLDAIFLFSFIDRIFCVVKSSMFRNPIVGPIARCAGYLTTDRTLRLVQECRRRLGAGENFLVFPEGTRSAGQTVRRFKPGFALIAVRSRATVVTVHVESDSGPFLRKGHPIFAPWNPLPLRYRFRVGQEFTPHPDETTTAFLHRVESYFQDVHGALVDGNIPSAQ